MDEWIRTDGTPGRSQPGRPPPAVRSRGREPSVPPEVAAEVRRAASSATTHHREVLVGRLSDALAAYERNRYPEAARLADSVSREAPAVAAVRELAGLGAYRSGRWRAAVRHLEAYDALTEDPTHVPAVMDSYRALRRPTKVAELWSALRHRSPDPEVLSEARIVAAASLGDQGDLPGAISLLTGAGAARSLRNPAPRHLRQWYALGDLYERAGDVPRARELFERVALADPDAYDVTARLEALGAPTGPGRRRRPASPGRRGTASGPRPQGGEGSDTTR
jgi:tetratricopeptide (TPR) repeat protein